MTPDIFVNVPKIIFYWVFVILSALLPLIFFPDRFCTLYCALASQCMEKINNFHSL